MQLRYFIINSNTCIMHIQGLCEHTKARSYPIRLFESKEELESYAGRNLRLCKVCQKALLKNK